MHRLCAFLATDPASPIVRVMRKGDDLDRRIDLRAVFQQDFMSLRFEDMPDLLRPAKGRYGLRDFEKVFCVDHKSGQDIYDMRGIDRDTGCMIVVRPDQYVAHILALDATAALAKFFEGIFLPVA
jgi:phenol 2-monooxygenase